MQSIVLPNGLRILYYPAPGSQSVNIGLYVKVGSRYETEHDNGITHMLEHLHFRQLGEMSQADLYYAMECMGGTLRASTAKEVLRFRMKVRPKYLKKSIRLVEKVLTTNKWTEEQFEAEKKVVLCEIYEKGQECNLDYASAALTWKEHSLAMPVLGTEESVKKLCLQEVQAHKERFFSTPNTALVITGAFSEVDALYVNKVFENVSLSNSQPDFQMSDAAKSQFSRKPDVTFVDCSWDPIDVRIVFDVDTKLVGGQELVFLNSIIGGGDGSVLPGKVREELGLVYEIYSDPEIYEDSAVLSITFSIARKEFYQALEQIMKLLRGLKADISQREIESNKVFFTENLWFWLEDTDTLNFQLGLNMLGNKRPASIETMIKRNKKITRERLVELTNIIFKAENASIAVVGATGRLTKKMTRWIIADNLADE